jgi:hypothetical protein
MSTNRREHRAWQDGHHLGHPAWLALRQRVRAHAVVPDWLSRLWQHALLGYLVAVLAQLAAVSLTLYLRYVLVDAFPYRGALSFLVVLVVALRWGGGPSLLSTLVAAASTTPSCCSKLKSSRTAQYSTTWPQATRTSGWRVAPAPSRRAMAAAPAPGTHARQPA